MCKHAFTRMHGEGCHVGIRVIHTYEITYIQTYLHTHIHASHETCDMRHEITLECTNYNPHMNAQITHPMRPSR